MKQHLLRLLHIAARGACDSFKHDGHVEPVFICHREDGEFAFVKPECFNEDDKDDIAAAVSEFCRANEITQVVFVAEAWVCVRPVLTPDIRPSEQPDRQEAIVVHAEDNTTQITATIPIIRDGAKASLGKLEITDPGMTAGRFVHLLRPSGNRPSGGVLN